MELVSNDLGQFHRYVQRYSVNGSWSSEFRPCFTGRNALVPSLLRGFGDDNVCPRSLEVAEENCNEDADQATRDKKSMQDAHESEFDGVVDDENVETTEARETASSFTKVTGYSPEFSSERLSFYEQEFLLDVFGWCVGIRLLVKGSVNLRCLDYGGCSRGFDHREGRDEGAVSVADLRWRVSMNGGKAGDGESHGLTAELTQMKMNVVAQMRAMPHVGIWKVATSCPPAYCTRVASTARAARRCNMMNERVSISTLWLGAYSYDVFWGKEKDIRDLFPP